MADEDDPSNLFSVPDLWRPSTWLDDALAKTASIDNIDKHNTLFTLNVLKEAFPRSSPSLTETGEVHVLHGNQDDDDVFFKLPSLLKELADEEPKSQTKPNQFSVGHPEFEPEPPTASSDDEDFWLSHDIDPAKPSLFRTWESFDDLEQEQGLPLFISEAGPAAFDALLASNEEAGDIPDVLDAAVYCACLLNLALGRSSVLFSWESERNSFIKTSPRLTISGLSLDTVKDVDKLCIECGNSARHLQAFAEGAYFAASTPTRVALAGVADRLVTAVRSELKNNSHGVRSILQLQSVVQPARSILVYFKGLVRKLAQQTSDEGMLSCLFQEAQASEYRDSLVEDATREVLRVLSKPWIEFVEQWVGLKAEEGIAMAKTGADKGFVKVADKMWIDDQGFELEEADYFLDEDRVPTFVPADMAQSIFETGRNLRFLRDHHPEHPLSRPDVVSRAMPPKLKWEFNWDAVSKLEERVNEYRNAVARAIKGTPSRAPQITSSGVKKRKYDVAELEYFGKDEVQVRENILASIRQLDQSLGNPEPQDELTRLIRDRLYRTPETSLNHSSLSPHWTLVPLLSFGPIIEAQSVLINQECMKFLFSAHHLRVHIDLLKQYFLLGNGLLVSRLTHALFDPDLSTAERRTGVALGSSSTMGLRLGSRQTWPPASSELRLALMGVLSDCYQSPTSSPGADTNTNNPSATLPGDLSFSVRDLSPQEIDRCMDPHGLEALDFLRLSYKPPTALRPVISPAILLKYDRIFKLLLRVLRMLYVANQLSCRRYRKSNNGNRAIPGEEENQQAEESNASRRFRIEATRFVHHIAAYFFDVGILEPWARFEAWLDVVQAETEAEAESCSPSSYTSTKLAPNEGGNSGDNANKANKNDKKKKATPGGGGGGGGTAAGPDVLRARQERVLDEMMGVLFLRKRQAPVMGLLEETFGVVLRFARLSAAGGGGEGGEGAEGAETARELYRLFRKKVEVFVTVCRGLGLWECLIYYPLEASQQLNDHANGTLT
ncbi:Spc98 family-domain-containing protein [Chaetomium fimeti]|uniref:Spindle pole body component n=1 Tax=Chaetomium fimeti TaxID=1854472 RepID=A0AAE0H9E3_9PEZI|nr:Spc98 family-domain-containing protein [Chaetomium fimeti]